MFLIIIMHKKLNYIFLFIFFQHYTFFRIFHPKGGEMKFPRFTSYSYIGGKKMYYYFHFGFFLSRVFLRLFCRFFLFERKHFQENFRVFFLSCFSKISNIMHISLQVNESRVFLIFISISKFTSSFSNFLFIPFFFNKVAINFI